MQAAGSAENIHVLVEGATALMVFAGFIISLLIKNNQATVKAELLAKHNEMQQDVDKKHSENAQAIAVHTASDDAKFDSIASTLKRIDYKIDKISGTLS